MKSRIFPGLVCALLVTAGTGAAQDSTAKGKSPKKKANVTFFDTLTPLNVTITVNLKQLQGDKGDSVPWRNATFAFSGSDGVARTIPMKMRTRGIWRLKKCEYPPIRLNFAKAAIKGTELEGLDKPKLVSFCRDAGLHEQYIVEEFQLYRVYNQLTPNSHKVRLIRLTYVDSASGKMAAKRFAFIVEEPEALAERLGGKMIKDKGAHADDMDDYSMALFGLFQFMIGNTDFSVTALHNAELLTLPTGLLIPVAYDFDFSGAINTTYASPEPRLRLDAVRTRRYRGYCVPAQEIEAAVAQFNAKKDAIFALYDDPIGKMIQSGRRSAVLEYLREFYQLINDRGSLRAYAMDGCLPRDKSDAPNR
jgi:hypothetical protein